MGTLRTLPGSIGFSEGSDRSGQTKAGFRTKIVRNLSKVLVWAFNRLTDAQRRYREIQDLQQMEDRLLKDIGITREQAQREANRLSRL